MKVKELLTTGGYGVKPYPPYNEEHVEVWRTKVKEGEQVAFLLTEEQAIEQFGEHDCWLAFHSDGTWNEPVTGEHVFAICIDKDV